MRLDTLAQLATIAAFLLALLPSPTPLTPPVPAPAPLYVSR